MASNSEPLVDITKYCPGVVLAIESERVAVEKTAYARLTVAKKLGEAQKLLPKGYRFIVRDAWRPAFIQTEIYFQFIERFTKKYPTWSKARIIKEVEKYVAPWKGKWASGHMVGAAIDLRIVDAQGRRLPMRSTKLTYQENAAPDHPKLPTRQKNNRALLRKVMSAVGFSNMPIEFWHWSYGDIHWARREKKKAIYGVVSNHKNMYSDRLCPCGSTKPYERCHG